MLEVICNAKTEDDMADHASALLRAQAMSLMGRKFIETHIELKEGYYELQEIFKTIDMLLNPALTFFTENGPELIKKQKIRKK